MTTKPNTWPFMAALPDHPSTGAGRPPGATQADAQPKKPPEGGPGKDENQPGFIKPSNTPVTPTDDQIMAD